MRLLDHPTLTLLAEKIGVYHGCAQRYVSPEMILFKANEAISQFTNSHVDTADRELEGLTPAQIEDISRNPTVTCLLTTETQEIVTNIFLNTRVQYHAIP